MGRIKFPEFLGTFTTANLPTVGIMAGARALASDCLNLSGPVPTLVYFDGTGWKSINGNLAVVPSSGLTDAQRIAFADSLVDSSVPSGDYLGGKVVVTRAPSTAWPISTGNWTADQGEGLGANSSTPTGSSTGSSQTQIPARAKNNSTNSFYFAAVFRATNPGSNEALGVGAMDSANFVNSTEPVIEFAMDSGNLFSAGVGTNVGLVAGVMSGTKTVQVSSVPFAGTARIDGRCYVTSSLVRGKINGTWLPDITTNIPSLSSRGTLYGRSHRNTILTSTQARVTVYSMVCVSFTSF